MNPHAWAYYCAAWCLGDLPTSFWHLFLLQGTFTMVVLLPFEHGAALPGLSAEASPNEVSVSGGMLGR